MGFFDNHDVNYTVLCCITTFIPPSPIGELETAKAEKISPLLIVIVCILGGCFLLVSYFAIIVKYCANLKKSRRPQVQIEEDLESHHDFFDENHGGVVNHPIWYIHTVGLAQSVIESIGTFPYKKGEGMLEGTECLVCLSEFEEDEALRLLPKCTHAFHVSCIDTWLMSHINCPSCRAPIVAATPVTASTGVVPSLGSSVVGEATQWVDLERGDGVDSGQNGDNGTSDLRVTGAEDESKEDDSHKDVGITEKDLEMIEPSVLRNLSGSDWMLQNGKQLGRRSASLDSCPVSVFCFSVANSLPLEVDTENSVIQKPGNLCPGLDKAACSSSKGTVLSKIPFSLKRSFSSGGKLMSSRLNRTRSAIMPL